MINAPALQTIVEGKAVVDFQFTYSSASIPKTAVDTTVASLLVRTNGRRAFIKQACWTIDAAGQPYVTYNLKKNGVPLPPYNEQSSSLADPSFPLDLPVPVEVQQGDLIEITARQSTSAPDAATAYGRLAVVYTDL